MATKEDILEQLVEEYLTHKGYFTRHNIKFLPRKDHSDWIRNQDSNHSDIDVLGYHPTLSGSRKIIAVSCKSWQAGFNPASEIKKITDKKKARGREAWRSFRELVEPKWSEAFRDAIKEHTGSAKFTYLFAVARLNGDRAPWENNQSFKDALGGNDIKIITFQEMLREIYPKLGTTLAATEIGRILQMFKAAKIQIDAD